MSHFNTVLLSTDQRTMRKRGKPSKPIKKMCLYSLHFLKSFSTFKEMQSLGSWKPGLLQARGLGGGNHPLSTSRGERDPHWTCKTAKDCHHLAAVWRPLSNELVVTIQFPLDRWSLHKESIALSSLSAKRRVDGAWELHLPVLLNQVASWVAQGTGRMAAALRGVFVFMAPSSPSQHTSTHASDAVSSTLLGSNGFPNWVLSYAATWWLSSKTSPRTC